MSGKYFILRNYVVQFKHIQMIKKQITTKEDLKMEKNCMVMGWIVEVLGLIASFSLAKTFGVSMTYETLERNWGLTIGIFLGCFLMASAIAFILFGISEALERTHGMEKIVDDLQWKVNKMTEKDEPIPNAWKCPSCGKQNPNYVGTCSCGQGKE